MFVFIHSFTPIQAEKSTSELLLYEKNSMLFLSERILKSSLSSQTWDHYV